MVYIYWLIIIQAENRGPCVTSECVAASAALMSAIDTSVDPCSDFFQVFKNILEFSFHEK